MLPVTTVFLYPGEGTYSATGFFEWNCPAEGSRHKLILFLAQESTEADQKIAFNEISKHGFVDIQLGEGRPIAVEAMNEPHMQVFSRYYEGALSEGSSIVWYP
jgi:hypothetical protein